MCFPAARNPAVKPAGTETSGKRPSQRLVNAMHAENRSSHRIASSCVTKPQIQIHRMPLDFWIMLLRNSEHICRLREGCRIEWPWIGSVNGVEGGYGVSHLDGRLAAIPLALPPSMTLLTEGGKGSKPTAQRHIKSTISSHDKMAQTSFPDLQ